MSNNRLHLDFSLQYMDERSQFLTNYLNRPEFVKQPPTEEEIETMGNYALWGKDRKTGLNAKQDKSVELSTRHGDWDTNSKVESLDALMESPTFNEAQLLDFNVPATKIKREVFSRDEALEKCPDSLRQTFLDLFRDINELDLKINYYDLLHNKRIKPPREGLLRKFSLEEQHAMQEAVTHWNQFYYLKRRHELIELRRQQYTLRDSYNPVVARALPTSNFYCEDESFSLGQDLRFAPLGLIGQSTPSWWLFRPIEHLNPAQFSEQQLKQIYQLVWADYSGDTRPVFDFGCDEHIYQVFQLWGEMSNAADWSGEDDESGTNAFMTTLKYYIDFADLGDLQRELLDLKLKKMKNDDIVREINKKWDKLYTANYISTIFKQRIIPKITEAVNHHKQIVDNLCFEEEFKQCSCCGRTLLRDSINFTKKARSKDGFTSRCKKCEKASRNSKKGGKDEE